MIIYIGLFLDNKENLLWRLMSEYDFLRKDGCRFILDHCTLAHKSQFDTEVGKEVIDFYKTNKGKIYKVEITHIGFSDKAAALKINFHGIPCVNKNPHITIATYGNGKPVDSNYIENWKPLNKKIITWLKLDAYESRKL